MSERSVLIIDDDQTLVLAMKEGLEGLGFKVMAAYDGLQGVLQAHQNRPDVIILDFQMPAGGGASVYERLRASTDTSNVPILFLTGTTVDKVKEKVRSTPNTYFLKKPATVPQMQVVLGKILGAAPAPAPAAAAGQANAAPPAKAGGGAPANNVSAPAPRAQIRGPASSPKIAPPAPAAAGAPAKVHQFELRVTYADTDRLGIIYYANYFRYFELGRGEFMRSLGLPYKDLEGERKLFLPVVEARCEYLAPSRYDDLLTIKTWLSWMGPASLCFQNEVLEKQGASEKLVARGFSRHALLNENWRPARLPKDLRALLAPYLAQQ